MNPHFIPSRLLGFQNVNSCWPIVMTSIHELTASHCDVTMTDCSHRVSMDTFFYHNGIWGQWVKGIVKYMSVMPSFLSFIIERICRAMNCLVTGQRQCAQQEQSYNYIAVVQQHENYAWFWHWTYWGSSHLSGWEIELCQLICILW